MNLLMLFYMNIGHNQHEKEFNCEDVCEITSCFFDKLTEILKGVTNFYGIEY